MESVDENSIVDSECQKEEIEKVMAGVTCPKKFECYKSNFKNLCKVRCSGAESIIECLSPDRGKCAFALAFGYSYFCQCPMRVYIAKNLNK